MERYVSEIGEEKERNFKFFSNDSSNSEKRIFIICTFSRLAILED